MIDALKRSDTTLLLHLAKFLQIDGAAIVCDKLELLLMSHHPVLLSIDLLLFLNNTIIHCVIPFLARKDLNSTPIGFLFSR